MPAIICHAFVDFVMNYMKNLISFLLISIAVIATSCDVASVTGNPMKDGNNFCQSLVSAAKANDFEKADMIISQYYDYYRAADLADRVIFIQTLQENDAFDDSDWRHFVESKDFRDSSFNQRMEILYFTTRTEAVKTGIW